MKKVSKRLLSVLMVLIMLVPSITMIAQATAPKSIENSVTFELDDLIKGEEGKVDVGADKNGDLAMNFRGLSDESPIVYNEEDSKYNAGSNLSYVGTMKNSNMGLYKVNDASNVHIVEGEDNTVTETEDYLDACIAQKPLTSSEMRSFLNLSSFRADPDSGIDMADPAGIEENHLDGARVINESNSASEFILALNEDSIGIFVNETNGDPVKGAYVTIRYTDLDNKTQTRTVVTDDDLGVAVFNKMKGIYFIAVDVQFEGYRKKTTLNQEIIPGKAIHKYIEPVNDNDLYIRCADLDGLDMMEYAGELTISDGDLFDQNLDYTIMVSKNGNKTLPSTINICAENAGEKRVVKTFQKTSSVYSDATTATYMCTSNWVSDDLFKKGDEIYYDIEPNLLKADSGNTGSGSDTKTKVTVDDAKSKIPMWTTTKFGFLDGIASYTFSDSVPVIGGDTVGLDLFESPVSFALLPDGSVFMSYGLNLDGKNKPETIVNSSWRPSKSKQTKDFFERANDDFMSKVSKFKEGEDIFAKTGLGVSTKIDTSYKFSVDVIFSGVGHYDKETHRVYLNFGAVFCVSGSYGLTWYVMLTFPFGTVPGYFGFEAGVQGRAAGYLTLSMDIKQTDITEILGSLRIETSKSGQAGISLDVILSLAAYVGIGIRGVANLQLNGSVYMDFGLDLATSAMAEYDKHSPRFRISGGYAIGVSATFMWVKYNKKIEGDSKMLFDSWGVYDKTSKALMLANDPGTTTQKIDLDASQSTLTKIESNGDNNGIEQYRIKGTLLQSSGSGEKLVDSKTLDKCTPRYIQTKDYAALFRMIPIDGKVRLCYQKVKFDGTLENVINVIPLPDRNSSQKNNDVVSYDVYATSTELTDVRNAVCVTMIGCSKDTDDVNKKAKSTYVVSGRVNLNDTTQALAVSYTNSSGYALSDPVATYNYRYDYTFGCKASVIGTDTTYSIYKEKTTVKTEATVIYNQWKAGPDRGHLELNNLGGDNFELRENGSSTASAEFNYKELTGSSWDGKSPVITSYKAYDGRLYVIIGEKLYFVSVSSSVGGGAGLHDIKDANGNDVAIPSGSDVYDIQIGLDGDICLTAFSSDYDKDGNCTGSTMQVYRLVVEPVSPDSPVHGYFRKVFIHGPQEIKLDVKEPSSFTALPESPTGACIAFYTVPLKEETTEDGVTDSAQLYQWVQTPKAQANVKSIVFTKEYISGTDTKIPMKVVCKNNGTNRLTNVKVFIYLNGVELIREQNFSVDLYPGEETVLDLTDTARPASMSEAKVYSIGVRTDIEGYMFATSSLKASAPTDDMYTVTFDTAHLGLDVDARFVGGRHRAFVTITNESIVSSQAPVIQIVGKFKKNGANDTNNERVIKNIELPVRKLTDADYSGGNAQGIKYNTMFDLDEIWDQFDNGKDILYSVDVKLVPKTVANGRVTGEEAEKLCNNMPESVYIANPNLGKVVYINANPDKLIMGKVDGNGIYNIGDTVKLTAMPAAGHKFLGWYNGEELVSKDIELTFNAKENVNLVAKFTPTVNAVQVDDVKMNYKQTVKLNTVVDADDGTLYTVTYTTSDPNIVSVDVDGNVTALKRGNAIVTCTVTDIYGNQKQDTCLVTVKYSPWQWLIKILLFGWIWY